MKLHLALHSVDSGLQITKPKATRLVQLAASLQAAQGAAGGATDLVKVMLGPEFLWGGYRGDGVDDIGWNYLLREWKRISSMYRDWLLIPGTAIWDNGGDRRNIAPILFDGELVRIYCKINHTGEDGGKTWKVDTPTCLGDTPCEHVFTHSGLKFGIEICNDYRKGALFGAVPERDLDVHILPASSLQPIDTDYYDRDKPVGGRALVFDHAATKLGGFLMTVDAAWPETDDNITLNRKAVVYRRTSLRGRYAQCPPLPNDLRLMEVYGFWRVPSARIIRTGQGTRVVVFPNLDLDAPAGRPPHEGPGRRRSGAVLFSRNR